MTRLLECRKPFDDETLHSYLLRLAEEIELGTIGSLRVFLGLSGGYPSYGLGPSDLLRCAELLGISPAQLSVITPETANAGRECISINGMTLSKKQFVGCRRRRIAPSSLKSSAHHRFFWDLAAFDFCPETGEVLVDSCPYCKRPLSWTNTYSVSNCGYCSGDLALAPAERARYCDPDTLQFAGDLVSPDYIRQQRALLTLHPSLRSLNRGTIIELAFMVGLSLEDDCLEHGRLGPGVFKASPWALTRGIRMLREYPRSLDRRVYTYGRLLSDYGFALRIRLATNVSPETKAFAADFFGARFPTGSGRKITKRARSQSNMLSITEAAKYIRVGKAQLRRLATQGLAKSQLVRASERRVDWFHEVEVARLADEVTDKVSVKEAIGETGLPYHVIEQIFALGLLALHSSATIEQLFTNNFFRRRDFQALFDKLRDALIPSDQADETRISVENCFQLLGGQYKPWDALIDGALDGSLPGNLGVFDATKPWTPKNLNVDIQLRGYILAGHWPNGPRMTTARRSCNWAEAQEYLNCLPRDIACLLNRRMLSRIGDQECSIDRSEVEKIGAAYISSGEIAARLGTKSIYIARWARQLDLEKPQPNFPFWRREDVEVQLPPMPVPWRGREDSISVALEKKPSRAG